MVFVFTCSYNDDTWRFRSGQIQKSASLLEYTSPSDQNN